MRCQSDYKQFLKLFLITTSFVVLFTASAYASETTGYEWSSTKILAEINTHRTSKNLAKLELNSDLSKLAMLRLIDMEENNYFAHESPTNNDIDSILERMEYAYEKRGENLAYGEFVNEADVMVGWMNSRWHKYNIEYADFNNIGIAQKVVHDYMGGDYILIVTVFTKEDIYKPSEELVRVPSTVKKEERKTLFVKIFNLLSSLAA